MTYGAKILMPNNIVLDTNTISYCIADSFNLAGGQSNGSKSYPEYAGYSFSFYQNILANYNYYSIYNNGARPHIMSVSYATGYPVVSWTLPSGSNLPSLVLVFAK